MYVFGFLSVGLESAHATLAYTLLDRTMIGAADQDDRVECGAVLVGKRLDVEEGERLTVVGRLREIEHKTDTMNGLIVPAWVEVRVQEVR